MRTFIYFISLIFIYLLFTKADGCGDDGQYKKNKDQALIKMTKDSVITIFESENLNNKTLDAFEETAKIRFAEFIDYTGILADTSNAKEFRKQSDKMIRNLFVSDKCVLRFINDFSGSVKEISLSDFIVNESNYPKKINKYYADSIWIVNKLKPENDSIYFGMLRFFAKNIKTAVQTNDLFPPSGKIDFYAIKREKLFGTDTLHIWTVLLGNADFK